MFKPRPEGGDGMKLQSVAKRSQPSRKQGKMVSEVRQGTGHGEHSRLCGFGFSLGVKRSLGALGRVAMGCDLGFNGLLLAAVSNTVRRSKECKQLGIDSNK